MCTLDRSETSLCGMWKHKEPSNAKSGRPVRSSDDHASVICAFPFAISLYQTLSWAVERYAKASYWSIDHELGHRLTSEWSIHHQFLSGPVGLYASDRTLSKLATDTLLAWCTITNKTFNLLLDLLRVRINEPSGQQKHGMAGSLLFKVTEKQSGEYTSCR